MGLIRKTISVNTLGLVDFRSDKERTAAYTKRNAREARKQTAMLRSQLAQDRAAVIAKNQHQALIDAQSGTPQSPVVAAVAPGWYTCQTDPSGMLRLWDGEQWTDRTKAAGPA
jgi:hypothetical protein